MAVNRNTILGATLAISLLCNAFAASYLVGSFSARDSRDDLLGELRYPMAVLTEMRMALREERAEVQLSWERLRQARAKLHSLSTAPQFDRAAVAEAASEVRRATTALQELGHQALLAALEIEQTSEP